MTGVTGKRADALLQLMDRIEYFTRERACDGLTDNELIWEPAPRRSAHRLLTVEGFAEDVRVPGVL